MQAMGFDGLIYDYTPSTAGLDGRIGIPTLLKLRNVAGDMHDYWCDREYFRIDPVQRLATQTSVPFFWSYDPGVETRISRLLTDETKPSATSCTRMTCSRASRCRFTGRRAIMRR